ncbi:MAG TPA: folylpolyglutamate synthase/dihydrofolate synthase family protein [Candidatus Limnocylindrales bacterium]|nr:folylpolyglutamate synthase/dihydrofolate synthase family protein [Candidatus Limnocylindrales bacterium]
MTATPAHPDRPPIPSDRMTYPQALDYLTSLGRFGIKLGLTRTQALLEVMGRPHHLFQGVHVGGTNGKGSVCAMLAAILQKAGYRVGLMPKPHLVSYTERIQVDQHPIAEDDFAALISEIQPFIDGVTRDLGPPTEFEILTTAALYYFARAGIDLLVCEVGLGGRLDSTNVLDLGVEVITNIALDHTQHLGDTLEKIAAEKAGILKEDSLAITGAQPPGLQVIEQAAVARSIPLWRLTHEIQVTAEDRDWSGLIATVTTPAGTHPDLRVPLLGMHQADNAALAIAGIDALRARGWEISAGAVRDGIAHARWPGRLEVVARDPIVLVDGGHNPAGLARAIDAVRHLRQGKPLAVVFGAMKDKDLPAMLALIRELAAPVVFSGIASDRAADPKTLSELYGRPAQTAATSRHALALAGEQVGSHGMVFVTGSLYLVGEIIALTSRHPIASSS